ncbi:hypothetical protein PFISCL1PPCAC_15353, partial [Pristionchus fissidentatus]
AWRKLHGGRSHVVPIVQFVESNDEFSARGGRVPLECMYESRVEGTKEYSLLNLCEDKDGVLGLLALPTGIFTVEPIKEKNDKEFDEKRSHVFLPSSHSFVPPRLVFDNIGDKSGIDTKSDPFNLTENPWEDINLRKERSRRAANSWDYHVEVLVVADAEMYRYHGATLENYLLTLFSTVASIYRHHSLRAAVNIVVVKILILKHEHAGPRITWNAQETLRNFCEWQALYNGRQDDSFRHHDVAILLTRGDICRSPGKCDTLGLAELGTMCDGQKSCAIIEDNGLSAAFTIAHELGHIFNVPHDDERKCSQFMSIGKANFHIMAPTLEYNTHPWSWSPCSAALIERFLDTNRGQIQCLFNKPQERRYYDALFEGDLPGMKYNVNQQCKFVFGEEASLCPYMPLINKAEPVCRRLWCAVTLGSQQGCRTQHMPWADGTPCAKESSRDDVCYRGECVGMSTGGSSSRKDGQWGEWGSYERCSRTCGGGIQKSVRDCNSPSPQNGGKYCVGMRERYRSCATEECPWDTPPFRDVQCAEYNSKDTHIYGLTPPVHWVPKYEVADNERCKLYCRVNGSAAFHLMKEKVIDGTPCNEHGDDLCVDGTCLPTGCDRILHSSTRRDDCGVCGGNGSSCEMVKGRFNERGTFGYNQVMKIPAGSANIVITQHAYVDGKTEDDNYLALRSSDGTFLMNGNFQVSMYRMQITLQDTIIEYSGSDNPVERINATGPIRSDVYVQVLSVGNLFAPDIRYEYMVSKSSSLRLSHQSRSSSHRWRADEGRYTECDRPCQGRQSQVFICVDSEDRRSHDNNCPSNQPTPHTRMCNVDCELKWHSEQSSVCSASCGHGTIQLRVFCARIDRSTGRPTPVQPQHTNLCPGVAPSSSRPCYSDCSGRRWVYSEWTECSASCGENGAQRRTARCLDDSNRPVDDSHCARENRDETERQCNRFPCPKWNYGMWSECSRSCDGGVRMRHSQCVDAAEREIAPHHCSSRRFDRENCNTHICTGWRFSSWGDCSVSCGRGVHTRSATCTDSRGTTLVDASCEIRERIVQKPCEKAACPQWKTTEWSECSESCSDGWQTRRVTCSSHNGTTLKESECHRGSRPSSHQECNKGHCPFWRVGTFSPCSVSCGEGLRSRLVECILRDQTVDHSFCPERSPPTEEKCKVIACAHWNASDWSICSVSCGIGSQERRVQCSRNGVTVHESDCDKSIRPRSIKRCDRECVIPSLPIDSPPPPSVYWATAPWSECTATCGEGIQRRQVICRENSLAVSPSRCSHLDKVESEQKCMNRPCGEWKVGEWMQCPVSCGTAEETRSVSCVSTTNSSTILADTTCDIEKRPESNRPCSISPCPSGFESPPGLWKSQPWTKCSVSCGGGWRRREVICERTHCIGTKPKLFEACNKDPCPKEEHAWQISPWTTCSVTCGGGEQRRTVWCEHSLTGKKAGDVDCKTWKPMEERDCVVPSCPSTTSSALQLNSSRLEWSTTHWSACSAKCGKGERRRMVSCIDSISKLKVASTECEETTRPNSTMSCRSRCARWKTQPWGECSVSCGTGVHSRSVVCQRGRAGSAPIAECSHLPKPVESSKCYGPPCPAYKWTSTPWSLCTDSCARKSQYRRVYCMSSIGKRAPARMCTSSRPPLSRACSTSGCPYHWMPTPWQTCSKTCGNGTQSRGFECRLKGKMAVDVSLSESSVPREKCAALDEPEKIRECSLPSCTAKFHWESGPWQSCSSTCGKGVRRRRVRCVDSATGARSDKKECLAIVSRPPRTEECFLKNCVASSCEEIRQQNVANSSKLVDGNYTLLLDGYPINVYCTRMNETIPRAYLNVAVDSNYAEIYGKRLTQPLTCPYDGNRNDSCACTDDGDANAGFTQFTKIRVDLHNRKININDFTFATTISGVPVSYATAGDCYSMRDCPQGRFSVDLRGTGVRIVDDLLWEDKGTRTQSRIDRRMNNTLIEGVCGGYCGRCAPDKYKGLVFEAIRKV